jgi:hypothetical protein
MQTCLRIQQKFKGGAKAAVWAQSVAKMLNVSDQDNVSACLPNDSDKSDI